MMYVKAVFGHLATVQHDLEDVGPRFGKDDLIHVDLDVSGLRLVFQGEIHFWRLVQQGGLGRVEHLYDLHLEAAPSAPTQQQRKAWLSIGELSRKEIGKKPVAVHFATRGRDHGFTEKKTS